MSANFLIDFVAFQTLTAAEMDTLADNDRALKDWSAYASASFPTALLQNGHVIQVKSTNFSAVASGTTLVPEDDTMPQITEGTEFMTQAITPLLSTSRLFITATCFVSQSLNTNNAIIGALFKDAGANALAAADQFSNVGSAGYRLQFSHDAASGSTSAATYRVRIGVVNASTLTFNGFGGTRRFGGISLSSLAIIEYKA